MDESYEIRRGKMNSQAKAILARIGIGVMTATLSCFMAYLIVCHSPYYMLAMLLMILFSVLIYMDTKRTTLWVVLTFLAPVSCIIIFVLTIFVF